jgi:hypothetical protein
MALLYISEYSAGSFAGIQAPIAPPVAVQSRIDFSDGLAHQSAAFSGDTRMIEVTCDVVCSVKVGGTSPVATTNDSRFFIGRVSYYIVTPGDKLSVILNT